MQSSKDYSDQVQQFYLEIAQQKSIDQQRKINLEIHSNEIESLINCISISAKDSIIENISDNIEKTIHNFEDKVNTFSKYSSELNESVKTPINLSNIQSLIKQVTKRNQIPRRILSEIEQLIYKLSSQSIDSIKKIRLEIENEKDMEKLPSLLSDLQKSTNINKSNLEKLKERNKTIMVSYKEKLECFNKNMSKLLGIEANLKEKKEKLNQSENIDSLLNEEILSLSFHLDSLKNSTIKIEEIIVNERVIRKFNFEKNLTLRNLKSDVKQLNKDLNNAECYYEDLIGTFFKVQKTLQSPEMVKQLHEKYIFLTFYALFLRIYRNKSKKLKHQIDLLNIVNEQIIRMLICQEKLSNLDNKLSELKEINQNLISRNKSIGKVNDKYRFILIKKFEVFDY